MSPPNGFVVVLIVAFAVVSFHVVSVSQYYQLWDAGAPYRLWDAGAP